MRLASPTILVVALWGCRSTSSAPTIASASAERPRAETVETANAVPRSSRAPLALVASGRDLTLRVFRSAQTEKDLGIRVSGRGFSAHADGDGALVADAVPEPSTDAPYNPKKEVLIYAGVEPNLFAFRRKDVPPLAPDAAAVLVLQGKKWHAHRLPARGVFPHAFLAWEGGAMLVDSPVQAFGWASSSILEQLDEPTGTVFTQVDPTGALHHPTLGLDPDFMTWGGSSAEQTLALVGTYGDRANGGIPAFGSHDIVVMRRHGQEPFRATVIVKANGPQTQSSRTSIREFGSAALLWPPPVRDDGTPVSGALAEGGDEIAWKGRASTVFRITDAATTEYTFRSASEQNSSVSDAVLVGQDVYAIVQCPNALARLVRATADGEPERVELPNVPTFPTCWPTQITVRAPDDLWVRTDCGPAGKQTGSAIFRRGHLQKPLLVP